MITGGIAYEGNNCKPGGNHKHLHPFYNPPKQQGGRPQGKAKV